MGLRLIANCCVAISGEQNETINLFEQSSSISAKLDAIWSSFQFRQVKRASL